MMKRKYVTKKTEMKNDSKSKLFDEYGFENHMKAPLREIIFSQTENYVDDSPTCKQNLNFYDQNIVCNNWMMKHECLLN